MLSDFPIVGQRDDGALGEVRENDAVEPTRENDVQLREFAEKGGEGRGVGTPCQNGATRRRPDVVHHEAIAGIGRKQYYSTPRIGQSDYEARQSLDVTLIDRTILDRPHARIAIRHRADPHDACVEPRGPATYRLEPEGEIGCHRSIVRLA